MALGRDILPDERDRHIAGKRDAGGDTVTIDGEGPELHVEETPEGGAIVREDARAETEETDFDQNLADDNVIPETELDAISRDLLRRVEHDKEARRKRDQQYEEGLKRTGIGEDAPGGAQFTGASKVTHPMLTEACIDFHASAMKELFPPGGPVRTEIIGSQTAAQLQVAQRQFKYMNWQMKDQIIEYRDELSVTMTQLPMGGSQYMKFWPDEVENRPCTEFVPVDDLLLPYGCQNFETAHRITHVQRLGESTFEERVESEMYRDLELSAPAETPTPTRTARANERIEGVEQPPENLDGLRIVYEINTFLKISVDEDKRLPYLVTIDERTNKILSIYRNWEEEDRRHKRLHWIVDYTFIPWRGAYKLGLAQMLGGLSAAATGSLRALLDSALVQTIPVLAKLKGAKFGAQSKTIDPMTITEIEAGTAADDIRKVLMAMPFNPPSPVLYALLGWITEQAKGVVTTAEEKIADASNNMPVGTALALMESGAKVFSAIHSGLHNSQKKALGIIARINRMYGVDEQAQVEKFGEIVCTTEDFAKPLGVIPVSDPNIFSEGQRYAQMQLVTGFALGADPKTGQPTTTAKMHDQYAVLKRTYELAKIPNVDEILPPPKKATELNAAAENSAVMLGAPIQAFPEQDHLSHLETHMRFIIDPLTGGSPAVVPVSWPGMIEHVKQHLSFLYAKTMHDLASEAFGEDITEAMKDKSNWDKIDKLIAAASRLVHDQLEKILSPLGPTINEMVQKIEQMKPPAPMDPGQSALQIAKLEDARERERMQGDQGLKGKDLQEREQKDRRAADAKDRELEIKDRDVSAKHGLAAADLHLKAKQAHDERYAAAQEQAIAEDAHHHQKSMDIAGHHRDERDQQHRHTLDAHGAQLSQQDQQHRQHLERRGAQREDQQAQHGQHMDITDRRLDAATRSGDLHLQAGGQQHDQQMDHAEHSRNVQNDEHARRMAEADHEQRAGEHKDSVKQQEKDRRQANEHHDKDLKARSAEKKAQPKKKK